MPFLLQIPQVEAYMYTVYIVYSSIERLLKTRTDPWRLSRQFSLLITIVFKRTKTQFDIKAQFTKHLKKSNNWPKNRWFFPHSFIVRKLPGFQIFMASSIKVFLSAPNRAPLLTDFSFSLFSIPTRKFELGIAAHYQ